MITSAVQMIVIWEIGCVVRRHRKFVEIIVHNMLCIHGCQTVVAQRLLLCMLFMSVVLVGVRGGGDQSRSTQVSADLMQVLNRE